MEELDVTKRVYRQKQPLIQVRILSVPPTLPSRQEVKATDFDSVIRVFDSHLGSQNKFNRGFIMIIIKVKGSNDEFIYKIGSWFRNRYGFDEFECFYYTYDFEEAKQTLHYLNGGN